MLWKLLGNKGSRAVRLRAALPVRAVGESGEIILEIPEFLVLDWSGYADLVWTNGKARGLQADYMGIYLL